MTEQNQPGDGTPGAGGQIDQRIKVVDGTNYIPESDLVDVKKAMQTRLDDALGTQTQASGDLTTAQQKVTDLEAKLKLSEVSMDDGRRALLDTQTQLTNSNATLGKEKDAFVKEKETFAADQLNYTRERLAKESGVDIEVLKQYTDPKDMEIAVLRKLREGGGTTQLPNKDGLNVIGGGQGVVQLDPSDPLSEAKAVMNQAKERSRGGRPASQSIIQ